MEIFKLFGSILINSDEAEKSLSNVDKKGQSIASTLGKGITTAAKWGAGIVTAASGAAAGMYKMATGASDTADNIDKMSQKIGISREAYQELDFVLSQSGTDVDKLQSGMKTMSAQVEKGNKAFSDLGIALKDSNGNARTQEEIFYDTVDALQKMEAGTKKSTIAAQLFGKAGTELMPLLNSEAGSLEAMRKEAHDLGLVLEDDVINSGVSLTDTLDKMKRSLGAVMTQLGARLMPIVEKAANFITSQVPKILDLVEEIAPIVEDAFNEILPTLINLAQNILPPIIDVVKSLLPPLSSIFKAITPIITQLVEKLTPIIVKIIEKLLPPLIKILDSLMPILDIAFQLLDPILNVVMALIDPLASILDAISPLLTLLLDLISTVLKPIMPLIEGTAQLLSGVLGEAIKAVAGLLSDGLVPILKGVIEFLKGDFEAGIQHASEGLVGAFSNALGIIDGLFGTNLQKWYQEVTDFWRDAGAKLYEATHADEIHSTEMSVKYGTLDDDIIKTSNELMRGGMSAGEALEKAKNEILDTTEKMAYFNANFADKITEQEALERQATLRETGQIRGTPKLAGGGVVYGKTLAVVGDNENVESNPEVVAPLSELQAITNNEQILHRLDNITVLLTQILAGGSVSLVVDGQKLATSITNAINTKSFAKGKGVVIA